MNRVLQPTGWPRPKGYTNGMIAEGEVITVSGQIGWLPDGTLVTGLAAQVEQTLRNIVAVLAEAGAGPDHIVRLTWFIVSVEAYQAEIAAIGSVYRDVMGRHFPPMSVVQVVRLVEAEALVEIEATAVRPILR